MFHILDFIDSKDIREHNANTQFTPMEQAVLIYHSVRTTVDDKMTAWRELLERYGEDDFKILNYGERQFVRRSNRQLVEDTVRRYEAALSSRYTASNVIFAASFEEIGHPRPDELSYFTDYDSAFAFIEAEKQSYFDDEDLKDVQTKARISIVQLNDKNRRYSTWFDFDTDLRMTGLFPCYSGDEDGMDNKDLDMAYIYVPVPFKKGDILKTINPNYKTAYGVLPRDNICPSWCETMGDSSDMIVTLDCYDYEENLFDYYDGCEILDLEKCSWSELPKDQKILILLSLVYQDKMEAGQMLYYYSKFGRKAYDEIAAYLKEE